MKKIWGLFGQVIYFIVWPALHFYLKDTDRTRVIVRAEGKVLFVKDWLGNSKWKLPGGGVHKGEKLTTSACRELYEETGLQLQTSQLKSAGSIDADGHKTNVKLHIFTIELPNMIPLKKQKLEILDIGWHDAQQLIANDAISKNTIAVLAKVGGFELKP